MSAERRRLVKLVRDGVEKFLDGDSAVKYEPIKDDAQFVESLRKKLAGEAAEYLLNPSIEELADVQEVVEALATHDPALGDGRPLGGCGGKLALKRAQKRKRAERGGFDGRVGMYLHVGEQFADVQPEPEPVIGSTNDLNSRTSDTRMSDRVWKGAAGAFRRQFGGGMIPFDNAYRDCKREGRTTAEAQAAGGYALIESFIEFVPRFRAHIAEPQEVESARGSLGEVLR